MIRVSYNPDTQLWKIQPQLGGDRVLAERVILDVSAKCSGAFLEIEDCVLDVKDLFEVDSRTVAKEVTLRRLGDLPGAVPKHDLSLEWCVMFDRVTDLWYLFRQNNQKVVVSTKNLQLDCHAISSKGLLHCHAEQLVDGSTNRDESLFEARSVLLRTSRVFDQAVKVPTIRVKKKILRPVSTR